MFAQLPLAISCAILNTNTLAAALSTVILLICKLVTSARETALLHCLRMTILDISKFSAFVILTPSLLPVKSPLPIFTPVILPIFPLDTLNGGVGAILKPHPRVSFVYKFAICQPSVIPSPPNLNACSAESAINRLPNVAFFTFSLRIPL